MKFYQLAEPNDELGKFDLLFRCDAFICDIIGSPR